MSKIRKPIPTTQRRLSEAQQKAFDTSIGNPNTQNIPLEQQTGITFNRAEKISFRDSTEKPFSIGIKDISVSLFSVFLKTSSKDSHGTGS